MLTKYQKMDTKQRIARLESFNSHNVNVTIWGESSNMTFQVALIYMHYQKSGDNNWPTFSSV
jgi:hypothetical protein